jgi:hypothetical protein
MNLPVLIKSIIKKRLPIVFKILATGKRASLNVFIQRQIKSLPTKIAQHFNGDLEAGEIVSFLRSNQVEMVPYFYTTEIRNRKIHIQNDIDSGLRYVEVNGNNIFFPKGMGEEIIIESVKAAIIEQDDRSPHKYLPANSINIGGDAAILCGASDGIYTLDIINKFKKIYLFEANKDWVEPLKKTLKNYLNKVEIVPYYVSDQNGPESITLDSFIEKIRMEVNYIQADIEGAELKMLAGAKKLLKESKNLTLSICCYHTKEQESELTAYLSSNGFNVSHSKGYLLLWMQYPLLSPFLRRGVLYAKK